MKTNKNWNMPDLKAAKQRTRKQGQRGAHSRVGRVCSGHDKRSGHRELAWFACGERIRAQLCILLFVCSAVFPDSCLSGGG